MHEKVLRDRAVARPRSLPRLRGNDEKPVGKMNFFTRSFGGMTAEEMGACRVDRA